MEMEPGSDMSVELIRRTSRYAGNQLLIYNLSRRASLAVQDLPPPAERRRHQPTQGSGEPILIERQYRQVCRTLTISMTSLI